MGFFAGIGSVFEAIGLLFSHGKLIKLALIPAVVGLLVSLLGFWLATTYSGPLLQWLWPEPDGWIMGLIWSVVMWLVESFSWLVAVLLSPWLVMLVGLPLCEPLAAHADAILGGKDVDGTVVGDIGKAISSTLGVIMVGLAGSMVLFALGAVPIIGLFTGFIATFLWMPIFIGFDCCDSSLSRRQLNFKQKFATVRKNFGRCLGLGWMATPLMAVPVLNLFGLPIAVIGGVICTRQIEKAGRLVTGN